MWVGGEGHEGGKRGEGAVRVVGGPGGTGGRAGAAMEHYSSSLSFGGASLFLKERRHVGAVGAGGAGGRAGAATEHNFLFSSLLSGEYGSMWAVGAVGVLEDKACGQWRGRVGAVRAVGAVGAVGAGGAGGRAGAAIEIEHYFLFSSLLNGEYGSMWAVGGVGVLEKRKACGQWRGRVGAVRAVGAGGAGGRAGAAIEHYFLFSSLLSGGSMWAVGAVGVLEERKACGQWRGWVPAVRAVGAVGAGGAGGRAGAANRTLFSLLFSS